MVSKRVVDVYEQRLHIRGISAGTAVEWVNVLLIKAYEQCLHIRAQGWRFDGSRCRCIFTVTLRPLVQPFLLPSAAAPTSTSAPLARLSADIEEPCNPHAG